ncbi:MAG: HAMP domain-containing protein [Hyphomicrobium sp.]|nr:HAMP domain-containing protein [Hyphomicrobium sp.]
MTALSDKFGRVFSTTAFRLTAAAVVALILAAAVLTGLLFRQTNSILTEQVLAALKTEAQLLRTDALGGTTAQLVAKVTALSRPDGPGLYFLTDATGAKIAGNLNRLPPELEESPQGGVFRYKPPATAQSAAERLAVAIPVDIGGGNRLIVGRDIEEQRAFADAMKRTFLIGFGTLSLLGLIGGLAISRFTLNRIESITSTSRSIMAGDMSRRVPVDGSGGELDDLAQNLNEMLDRIEGLMSGLREVSDNIAHDLKTPINRLRNSAEAALRDSRGEAAYREGLERTIEKADDLIKTFNALLLIARLEAGPLEESLEQFDLGAVVDDVAELYMPAAEEDGFDLTVETEKGVTVMANRQLIGQAVANLIDNAIKYSRVSTANGAIRVAAGRAGDGAVISVADNGPGISAPDRKRVVKRFVRLEESRTKPGTGLGLSLVAAVARLHHGEVRLHDNHPGLKVELHLSERVVVHGQMSVRAGDAPVLVAAR